MGARLDLDQKALERSGKLPGPGNYAHAEVTGIRQGTNSRTTNEPKFSFGLAKDRFAVPTYKKQDVGPGEYKPQNNLNENFNSTFN